MHGWTGSTGTLITAEPKLSRMLKQSLFSPAQPRCVRTPRSPSSVFASFDLQRGPSRLTNSAARTDLVLLIRRTVHPRGYVSALHSLRPCWTNCLSILPDSALLTETCESFHHYNLHGLLC